VDPLLLVSALLIATVLALVLVVRSYRDRIEKVEADLEDAIMARRRVALAQDSTARRLAPLLARYPYDARAFRFVGSPVDGVQFDADRVVFVRFTGAGLAATPDAERVRDLVRAGRVEWADVPLEPTTSQEGLS
jgi:predicted Holliday junction resolvase-like endonuclease